MNKIILFLLFNLLSLNLYANEEPVLVNGEFKLPSIESLIQFQVRSYEKQYLLELKADEKENAQATCYYKITRLTAPQQTRGVNGLIFAKAKKKKGKKICTFALKDKALEKILNNTLLINIEYRLKNEEKIQGHIEIQTLNKDFNAEF
jgi:hypothetical protein